MTPVEVNIMGQTYMLLSPEEDQTLLKKAAQKVDHAMCTIRDAGKIKARDRIAVLASLNLTFDSLKIDASSSFTPTPPTAQKEGALGDLNDEALHNSLETLLKKLDQVLNEDGQLI